MIQQNHSQEETRHVYVILHGEKQPDKPNPPLTAKGMKQAIEAVSRKLLPRNIKQVISGTGLRHLETAKCFGLDLNAVSVLCGTADSSDYIPDLGRVVRLANDKQFAIKQWLIPATHFFLKSLPNDTVLIAGRPFMIGLGYKDALEGMVFKITFQVGGSVPPQEIEEIKILFPLAQAVTEEKNKTVAEAVAV